MTLDHDSGALTGDVIAGPYAGRSLAEFDLEGLRELIRGFDDESRALLAGLSRSPLSDSARSGGCGCEHGQRRAVARQDDA